MSNENAPKKKFRGVLREETDVVIDKSKSYVKAAPYQKYQRNQWGNSTNQSAYQTIIGHNATRHESMRDPASFKFTEMDELTAGSQFETIREDELSNLKTYFTEGSLVGGTMKYKTIIQREKFPVIRAFENMGLTESLCNSLIRRYPDGPTGIQCAAIPGIMQFHTDFVIRSPTGSGKTAAFLIPVINQIELEKEAFEGVVDQKGNDSMSSKIKKKKVFAIIILPGRDLAMQMAKEAIELTKDTNVKVAYAIGEIDYAQTMDVIRNGCDILVGTLGKLEDFIYRKELFDIDDLMYIIADEADCLERTEGFRTLFHKLKTHKENNKIQAILSSATLSFESELNLRNPTHICVKDDMPPPTLIHRIINVGENPGNKQHPKGLMPTKIDFLVAYLNLKVTNIDADGSKRIPKTIVYANGKRKVDFVAIYLLLCGFRAYPFHGDKTMDMRTKTISKMKNDEIDVIVATNLLSRGINLKIDYVINFDLPLQCSSYVEFVHRVGRTARVGNLGIALTFYDPKIDYGFAPYLQNMLKYYNFEVPDFISNSSAAYVKSSMDLTDQFLAQHRNLASRNPVQRILCKNSILPPHLNITFA